MDEITCTQNTEVTQSTEERHSEFWNPEYVVKNQSSRERRVGSREVLGQTLTLETGG